MAATPIHDSTQPPIVPPSSEDSASDELRSRQVLRDAFKRMNVRLDASDSRTLDELVGELFKKAHAGKASDLGRILILAARTIDILSFKVRQLEAKLGDDDGR